MVVVCIRNHENFSHARLISSKRCLPAKNLFKVASRTTLTITMICPFQILLLFLKRRNRFLREANLYILFSHAFCIEALSAKLSLSFIEALLRNNPLWQFSGPISFTDYFESQEGAQGYSRRLTRDYHIALELCSFKKLYFFLIRPNFPLWESVRKGMLSCRLCSAAVFLETRSCYSCD